MGLGWAHDETALQVRKIKQLKKKNVQRSYNIKEHYFFEILFYGFIIPFLMTVNAYVVCYLKNCILTICMHKGT